MNYEKLASKINEVLNFNLTKENMNNLIEVVQTEHENNIRTKVHKDDENDLEKAAEPLLKFLCENYHPHVTAIITGTSIELMEGIICIPKITKFIVD